MTGASLIFVVKFPGGRNGEKQMNNNVCRFCGKKYNYELVDTVVIDTTSDNVSPRYFEEHICPECTEKLLELLDKHFPRLNLEDEL